LVLIEPGALQGVYQILGNLYAHISFKFNLPSKDNYVCEGEYILPFTGKWTVYNGGVDKELSHSWGLVSQRYAYDFLVLGDDGSYFSGDSNRAEDYLCYGRDIISPADGVVVQIVNKHQDSRVKGGQKAYCDTPDIRGNYIVIKHHNNEYSLIAHIKLNSFMVKIGDTVKQGETIAKCGNSGNSSEPHIHFQLQTGKSFYLSAGLPIAFSDIKVKDSPGYKVWSKLACKGNLQVTNGKLYIGRGLDVENLKQ